MKRRWTVDELADHWTLHADELAIATTPHTSSNQLGFALMLKWFQYKKGQFPRRKHNRVCSFVSTMWLMCNYTTV